MKCLAATKGPTVRVNAVVPGLLLTEWVIAERAWGKNCDTDIVAGPELYSGEDTSCQR